jgi:purine-nucleoside phosphorylase
MQKLIAEAIEFIKTQTDIVPEVGVVLGTGLGNRFIEQIENQLAIPYQLIPNFPVSTVEHHKGRLVFGLIKNKPVVVMQGRFHYYEGYTMQQITMPIRVMKMLGIKNILISNAAGHLNLKWKKGDLMLLDDHINLQPDNPLRGKNEDELGLRFPDMSQPYNKVLNKLLKKIAKKEKIKLREGVYACVAGPNLETRAEYRFIKRIGADAVGMSTVPEVIVAVHSGIPCCAISVLTDDCDPDNLKPVKLSEIIAIASKAEPKLNKLFVELIKQL